MQPNTPSPAVSTETISSRWAILGATRFVLASIVFVSHLGTAVRVNETRTLALGPFAAVIGFFLISGYSIAHSLERHANPRVFYMRRMHRIFPLVLASMLLSIVPLFTVGFGIHIARGDYYEFPTPPVFLGNLLLLQGFWCKPSLFDAPLWSLGLEWSYYLWAPYIKRLSCSALLSLALASAALYVTHSLFCSTPYAMEVFGRGALCLVWAWLLGFAFHEHGGNVAVRAMLVALPVLMLTLHAEVGGIYAPATILCCSGVLLFADRVRLTRGAHRTMRYLGELSYPLYVVHWPLLLLLVGHANLARCWLVCMAGAVLLYHGVDAPARGLYRFRFKRLPKLTPIRGEASASAVLLCRVGSIAPEPESL